MNIDSSISLQDCFHELEAAIAAIALNDLDAAFHHLSIAHGICHADKTLHLKVHRTLIRLGWLKHSPKLIFTHVGLLTLAWIFD